MTIFGLKMMVISCVELFILKLKEPLQRYLLTCEANQADYFLHWVAVTLNLKVKRI